MLSNLGAEEKFKLYRELNSLIADQVTYYPVQVVRKVLKLELEMDQFYLKFGDQRVEIASGDRQQMIRSIRKAVLLNAEQISLQLLDAYQDLLNQRYRNTIWRFRKHRDGSAIRVYKKDDPSWVAKRSWIFLSDCLLIHSTFLELEGWPSVPEAPILDFGYLRKKD